MSRVSEGFSFPRAKSTGGHSVSKARRIESEREPKRGERKYSPSTHAIGFESPSSRSSFASSFPALSFAPSPSFSLSVPQLVVPGSRRSSQAVASTLGEEIGPRNQEWAGALQGNVLRSADIHQPVKVKIDELEGSLAWQAHDQAQHSTPGDGSELVVTAQIFSEGRPVSVVERTSYKFNSKQNSFKWNEWLTFSCKYSEICAQSMIAVTVWHSQGCRESIPLGGCAYPLFNDTKMMKRGKHKVVLERHAVATGQWNARDFLWEPHSVEARLEKLLRRFDRHDVRAVKWLDKHTYRHMERIKEEANLGVEEMLLTLQFPDFKQSDKALRVAMYEKRATPASVQRVSQAAGRPDLINAISSHMVSDSDVLVTDTARKPYEDLVEAKFFRLSHLRPNMHEEQRMRQISRLRSFALRSSTPGSSPLLTSEDEKVLWRFRFWLMRQTTSWAKGLLSCVLRSVDWAQPHHRKDVTLLLRHWPHLEVADLLELLNSEFSDPSIRHYAVESLERHTVENAKEVSLCIPQLVQACRYEDPPLSSRLKDVIVDLAMTSLDHASFLYWYLSVGKDEEQQGEGKGKRADGQARPQVMTQLFEYFKRALAQFNSRNHFKEHIEDQVRFIQALREVSDKIKRGPKERRGEKVKALQEMLGKGQFYHDALANLSRPLRLPQDPSIIASGVIADKVGIFKSAMAPFRLPMRCVEGSARAEYSMLFKNGDDLRQDQLVMQIITLTDMIWKQEGLDLKLTPYRVLATGQDNGLVEMVFPSDSLQCILDEHNNNISKYLADNNNGHRDAETGKYVVPDEVVRTFIYSTAGYSVISYLLGIGDRHLDNLLMTKDGHLFHIDFGFIFGRDPKPLPPPMKIRQEMIEVMGGSGSEGYQQFKKLCCTAFCKLRKQANLIINLVSLMRDANIPDMHNPDKAISFLLDRFHLRMEDEKVWQHMQELINKSGDAIGPVIMDAIHKRAQQMRS